MERVDRLPFPSVLYLSREKERTRKKEMKVVLTKEEERVPVCGSSVSK